MDNDDDCMTDLPVERVDDGRKKENEELKKAGFSFRISRAEVTAKMLNKRNVTRIMHNSDKSQKVKL